MNNGNNLPDIIFTGCNASQMAYLRELANEHGLKTSELKSVPPNLKYLVIGDNPSKGKLAAAKLQGTRIIELRDLIEFLNNSTF